ncbi:MAG: hypothetical protein WCI73_04590, partial [Phycisphaerae bacterium]
MRKFLAHAAALLLLLLSTPIRAQQVPSSPPAEAFPDAADLITWPVKGYPVTAPGSVVNVGTWLFDAPAGKHGFIQTTASGQLVFEDKTPAHFWGTTTVYGATFPDKTEEIPKLADAIAAAGYNLVRFHHNDVNARGIGYLEGKSNYALNPTDID